MAILICDIQMPKEGFIELLIRDDGLVQQTGESVRIDGMDYYKPYSGEIPVTYHAADVFNYEELLAAAKALHTWIFLNTADEQEAYKECGLSDEMNAFLGYGGSMTIVSEGEKNGAEDQTLQTEA